MVYGEVLEASRDVDLAILPPCEIHCFVIARDRLRPTSHPSISQSGPL
jgi:hypothetical protein